MTALRFAAPFALILATASYAETPSNELCVDAGPQTPRDISNGYGLNTVEFPEAPDSDDMNLCNIHFHENAEHRGGRFLTYAGDGDGHCRLI